MAAAVMTLYDAEESLTAFLDTQDMVTPDQEQAFLADFETALTTASDKRDRVAGRLSKLEAQQAFASAEIARLQAFKKHAEAQQERLEGCVSYVIQRLGKDAKGKWRKLEGRKIAPGAEPRTLSHAFKARKLAPDKRAIKADIEAGVEIAGAKLVDDKTTL